MSEEYDFSDMKPEHRVFCENYVIEWNGTQSYLKAYPNSSYESAMSSASDLLRKPNIKDYIEHIQKDIAKLAGISALGNALELKNIAKANMSDFKKGWMTEVEFDNLTHEQKSALSEIVYTEKEFNGKVEKVVKFKLHDKIKAIEILNKMFGYDSALRIDHTTNGDKVNSIPLVLTDGKSYEDLKNELKPE